MTQLLSLRKVADGAALEGRGLFQAAGMRLGTGVRVCKSSW